MKRRPIFIIEDNIELPAELQRKLKLDAKALEDISRGYYKSPYKAALALASQYKPDAWENKTEIQKNNYVRVLARRYTTNLNN